MSQQQWHQLKETGQPTRTKYVLFISSAKCSRNLQQCKTCQAFFSVLFCWITRLLNELRRVQKKCCAGKMPFGFGSANRAFATDSITTLVVWQFIYLFYFFFPSIFFCYKLKQSSISITSNNKVINKRQNVLSTKKRKQDRKKKTTLAKTARVSLSIKPICSLCSPGQKTSRAKKFFERNQKQQLVLPNSRCSLLLNQMLRCFQGCVSCNMMNQSDSLANLQTGCQFSAKAFKIKTKASE